MTDDEMVDYAAGVIRVREIGWEYKLLLWDITEDGVQPLNALGREGWEVVSCFQGAAGNSVMAILKRRGELP